MKKILGILAVLAVLAVVCVGAAGAYTVSEETHEKASVNFYDDTKVEVVDVTNVGKGDTITVEVTPSEGYKVVGILVKDGDGKRMDVERIGENEFEFVMPGSNVKVKAYAVEQNFNGMYNIKNNGTFKKVSVKNFLLGLNAFNLSEGVIKVVGDIKYDGTLFNCVGYDITLDMNGYNIERHGGNILPMIRLSGGSVKIVNSYKGKVDGNTGKKVGGVLKTKTGTKRYAVEIYGLIDNFGKNTELVIGKGVTLWDITEADKKSTAILVSSLIGTEDREGPMIVVQGCIQSEGCAIQNDEYNKLITRIKLEDKSRVISTDGCAMYLPGRCNVELEDGCYVGGKTTAIEIRAGTLMVKGGQIKSTAKSYECKDNGSGTTTKGAAIAIAQYKTKLPITVYIAGGEITGYRALSIANPQKNEGTVGEDIGEVKVNISGGLFAGIDEEGSCSVYKEVNYNDEDDRWSLNIMEGTFNEKIFKVGENCGGLKLLLEKISAGAEDITINVTGNMTVDDNITIPAGVTVIVEEGKTLKLYGIMDVKGTVDVNGGIEVGENGAVNENDGGVVNAEAKVTDGSSKDVFYGSLKNAVEAARDGDTVTLLKDVDLSSGIKLDTEGNVTIDGEYEDGGVTKKHIIKYVGGDNSGLILFNFDQGGTDSVETWGKNYTLRNISFDGNSKKMNYFIKCQACGLTVDNCEFKNIGGEGKETKYVIASGFCDLTIENSNFRNNTCEELIDYNANISSDDDDKLGKCKLYDRIEIDNCLFDDNDAIGDMLVYLGIGSGIIQNSTFSGNMVTGRFVVYESDRFDVKSCMFSGNAINGGVNKEGCVVCVSPSYNPVEKTTVKCQSNVFLNNTLDEQITVGGTVMVAARGEEVQNVDANLSGNYWENGRMPTYGAGKDIYVKLGVVAPIDSYGYGYVSNSDTYGVTVQVATTVTVVAGVGGSVDKGNVENVDVGSSVNVEGNKVTLGGITVTATQDSGYVFDSWNVTSGSKVVKDMSVTATFRPEAKTTLFYNGNGGTTEGITDDVGIAGRSVTVTSKKPVRDGYEFDKWYESPDKSGTSYVARDSISSLNSNKTLYAGWNAKPFKVIFNGNYSGAATHEQNGFTAGVAKQLDTFESTGIGAKTGCTFVGWATSATGPVQYRDGQTVTLTSSSDVTLYAVWQENAEAKYEISGSITGPEGKVSLKVMLGNVQIGDVKEITLPASGGFVFTDIPNGVYNVVATQGEKIVTELIKVKDGDAGAGTITIPEGDSKNSIVEVKEENATPNVVVGNLDDEAQGMAGSGSVTVVMTVKSEVKADVPDTPEFQEEKKVQDAVVSIDEKAKVDLTEPTVTFVNITVTKYVQGSSGEKITKTSKDIEIVIPYDLSSANSVMVYKNHNGSTTPLVQAETGAAGTFKVDKAANKVYIYTNEFSVYAIATSTESMPEPTPEQQSSTSTVTVFRGTAATYDGTILFDRSVVVTSAELPGASSASVTPVSTKDGGWYTFKLDADGFAGNGMVWFQVPLDVIAIKDMTEKDVSLFDCDTFYLSKDGRYAYYKASVAAAGTYTIGFEAGAAQTEGAGTPVAPIIEPVVEPIAPVTPQPTATPAPVLGLLAGLGAAAVLLKRRQ